VSGPEFHVSFGQGRVGSLHLWVGFGRVKKIGPTSNSALPVTPVHLILTFCDFFVHGLDTGT